MEAREFLQSPECSSIRSVLLVHFQTLVNQNPDDDEVRPKRLTGTIIREFKKRQVRLFCFRDGNAWVLTNGILKKDVKAQQNAIHRAEKIRMEDLELAERLAEHRDLRMARTMVEEFTSTPEGMAVFQQERVILETAILIRKLLKERKLTKADLATRLGKSKAFVTQLLDGRANMTLRTISDVMCALGQSLKVSSIPLEIAPSDQPAFTIVMSDYPASRKPDVLHRIGRGGATPYPEGVSSTFSSSPMRNSG